MTFSILFCFLNFRRITLLLKNKAATTCDYNFKNIFFSCNRSYDKTFTMFHQIYHWCTFQLKHDQSLNLLSWRFSGKPQMASLLYQGLSTRDPKWVKTDFSFTLWKLFKAKFCDSPKNTQKLFCYGCFTGLFFQELNVNISRTKCGK